MEKVAHIIKSLDPGGIETWLKDLSYINDHQMYKLFFLLQSTDKSFYENEIIQNNGTIKKFNLEEGIIKYSFNLFKYFKKNKIDIVHSHVNLSSGWILFIAYLAGVKKRIAHCHNDKRKDYKKRSYIKKVYFFIMKLFVNIFSTAKISVSRNCAPSMFYSNTNYKVIPCGLRFKINNNNIKRENLNLNKTDIVICHIGRLTDQKNQEFSLKILEKLNNKKYKLLFIGEGKNKDKILVLAKKYNILDQVIFLGLRNDVMDILINIVDILVLPSKYEGLGLVAIESQIAKKYTLVSNNVPSDTKISNLIEYLPINSEEDIKKWCDRINKHSQNTVQNTKEIFIKNDFSIEDNYKKIIWIYNNDR
ncbi:TPA: glycosyltransferase [Proteus mirabilis]